MDSYEQLRELIASCEEDYRKAKGGNKAAGTRVRKIMQDIKNTAQTIRQEMLIKEPEKPGTPG
jgi:hypothetical protein